MSTIKEVAQSAGVSVATVSRVINKDPAVRPATRDKVMNAIAQLSYTPNLLGRHLRQTRTNKILVLIPSISNQFYSKIIRAMEKVSEEQGYDVLVCMTHNDPRAERRYIDMLVTRVVDGIVFFSSSLSAAQMDELASGFPVVQCSEYIEGSNTDMVVIDDEKAAYDAVSWLLRRGHKRVAYMGSQVRYSSGIRRERGYRKAVTEAGGKADERFVFLDDYSYPGGGRMAGKYLECGSDRPSAIFCISDSMAIGCINRLISEGVDVPGKVSVMGFDDTSIAKVFCPAITTVSQPQSEIGRLAAELLIDRIRNSVHKASGGKLRKIILPHDLVIRNTTI
ncbi:MAG: LacI family DNA-binding transcriptional regulator [Saccharofermentanales bacterium]